jgi:twitching motility protein PilT
MTYQMHDLLDLMISENSSDLHLHVGRPPCFRIDGSITPVDGPILENVDVIGLVDSITTDAHQQKLKSEGAVDFGFNYQGKARFRVNAFRAKGAAGMVIRQIPNDILPMSTIGLPDKIKELLLRPRGLILVTGPTGSGKSTTLASMLDWINTNRNGHIITIEDPIEYYHTHKKSVVTQREVGNDATTFSSALRSALRQDPDVILVGEMRDLETMEAAISAAETGHLVFATLHTTGAARTVDRIVDAFPSGAKDQIRTQLASSIVSVISQVLCKRIGGGRVAAFEIMVNTSAIAQMIRENKTFRITSDIQTGSKFGMFTLDAHLQSLYNEGKISAGEAIIKAQNTTEMKEKVQLG